MPTKTGQGHFRAQGLGARLFHPSNDTESVNAAGKRRGEKGRKGRGVGPSDPLQQLSLAAPERVDEQESEDACDEEEAGALSEEPPHAAPFSGVSRFPRWPSMMRLSATISV